MSASEKGRPAKPREAATIILIRDLAGVLQVYLMRRSTKSSFMGGNFVFPGGKVDGGDGDAAFWGRHGDLPREAVAERLHDASKELTLLAYAVAAIRETWEEAGVLLAALPNGDSSKDSTGFLERLQSRREGRGLDPDWLRTHLVAKAVDLAFSSLWPWSHWIAPEAMKQRFDTRFFIARMPDGQTCRPDPRETPEGRWMAPREALEANARGDLSLSPPTLVTLHHLLPYGRVGALEAALPRPDWGPALMPKMFFTEVGPMVIQVWDPAFAAPEETLPVDRDQLELLPVGAPFSRLWNDHGSWRPVA